MLTPDSEPQQVSPALEWRDENVRIHLLAHFISQEHKDHPNERALIRHPRRLLLAIDECPSAVTKAEDFICVQHGTLKNWATRQLIATYGPQLSDSERTEIHDFLIQFA